MKRLIVIISLAVLILTTLCVSDIVRIISADAAIQTIDAINKCRDQLLQKYPSVEAISKQFGDGAKWQEKTIPSPHDENLELQIKNMEYPGIEIHTLGYTLEDEDRFFIISLRVKEAGYVDFLKVDIGSAREDVIKSFGKPQKIEGNVLMYHDEAEFYLISFTIENNVVVKMRFDCYPD